jgi:uncharacterized protein YsxB (DUF464 family)
MDAELIVIVSAVVSLITLILFFKMVSDIANIKKQLNPTSSELCFDLAMKHEFKNNQEKALDMYYEGLYIEAKELSFSGNSHNVIVGLKKRFEDKIKGLGGEQCH